MSVPVDALIAHPENDNKMDSRKGSILRSHIAQTGLYPAIVVRSLEESVEFAHDHAAGKLQIMDGHHRFQEIKDLGHSTVRVEVWPGITDARARVLILTLNRLEGTSDAEKRAALIRAVKDEQDLTNEQIAAMIPETEAEIDRILQKLGDVTSADGGDGDGDGSDEGSEAPEIINIFAMPDDAAVIKDAIKEWLKDNDPNHEIYLGREGVALRSILEG